MERLNGELGIIAMKGCEQFVDVVDAYLKQWRRHDDDQDFVMNADCIRFGSGEGKAMLHDSARGHDIYIISDCFNYGVEYKMQGRMVPMSPDDHFADLKRVIASIAGKATRISVIMPMLYEGRQHKRTSRESLDCALALQELVNMGVSNIITFDAHDPRVQNAIPLSGFDNIRPSYQMLKALVRAVPDVRFDKESMVFISPDEGAMGRSMYYASLLGVDLGMFYKRRNYAVVIDGKNPIEAHEYLGRSVEGKDVIVVDDMISSGDSMLDVCRQLKSLKARRIFVFSSFGLFSSGLQRFDDAYAEGIFDKIFTTKHTTLNVLIVHEYSK